MRSAPGVAAGAAVGTYRLERLIGRGGMGAVYLAFDSGLERQVALKLLSPAFGDDDGFRERLLRESRLVCRVTA